MRGMASVRYRGQCGGWSQLGDGVSALMGSVQRLGGGQCSDKSKCGDEVSAVMGSVRRWYSAGDGDVSVVMGVSARDGDVSVVMGVSAGDGNVSAVMGVSAGGWECQCGDGGQCRVQGMGMSVR